MKQTEKLSLEIIVDDVPVLIHKFVKNLVKNVVYALITSLKLESTPQNIVIKLKQ